MPEHCVHQPPQGISGEPDCHENQQDLTERLLRDRLQRAALVGRLAARADSELDRQDADDRVDRGSCGEAAAAEHLESGRLLDLAGRLLAAPKGQRSSRVLNANRKTNDDAPVPGTCRLRNGARRA